MAKIQPAVQLYTVRDHTKTDFAGTMKKIAQMGYTGVELAGFGNLSSAKDVRKALDDAKLKVVGAHIGLDPMEKDLNKVLDEQETIGNKMIICPFLADSRRTSGDAYRQVAQSMNTIAAACAKRGFGFAYHNHSFEFQKFDGETGLDILWKNSDAKLVKSELDVYWIQHGGLDPVTYINQLGNRVALLHLKDMAAGPEKKFAEVGTGILDFKAIVAAGQKHGVQAYVVEQDNCYGKDPLEAIKTSMENLKKLGLA